MRKVTSLLLAASCAVALAAAAAAQPPGAKPADAPARGTLKDYSNSPLVTQMMAFDKNKDGKLTKDEVTDPRLHRLFDRADANKDGVVTREELVALAAQMYAEAAQGGGRGGPGGPGGRGPGGPGGPGGRFPGGPGGPGGGPGGPGGRGPGGFGGAPQPGQILPPFVLEQLNLTAEQKKQLEELQKEVDGRLGKILTAEQKKQLQEMRPGQGRGGPPGEGGRPGRPGGERPE
jgi:Spy/CpxP family protein refolding chaperone